MKARQLRVAHVEGLGDRDGSARRSRNVPGIAKIGPGKRGPRRCRVAFNIADRATDAYDSGLIASGTKEPP